MIISVLLLHCLFFLTYASQDGNHLRAGPYMTTLVRTGKCKNPPIPYEKDPAYLYYTESYNSGGKTLLRANFTVVRVNPSFKTQIRAFAKEGDKWKIMYINKSSGCEGFVNEALKLVFKVSSSGRCIPKGTYTYKDVDFNDVQQRWLKTFMYGKFLWNLQILTKAGTNVCWEYETDITPK